MSSLRRAFEIAELKMAERAIEDRLPRRAKLTIAFFLPNNFTTRAQGADKVNARVQSPS